MRRRDNFRHTHLPETIYPDGHDAQWGHEPDDFGMVPPYYIRSDIVDDIARQGYEKGLAQGELTMERRAMKMFGIDLVGAKEPERRPRRVMWGPDDNAPDEPTPRKRAARKRV